MGNPLRARIASPCCIERGLQFWTWNACGISFDDLQSLLSSLSHEYSWDVLCLQEGLKQCEPKTLAFRDFTILSGRGTGRGAPMLALRKSIAQKIMRFELAEHFVAALCATSPPVLFFSLHCPQPQFTDCDYENVWEELALAIRTLSSSLRHPPRLIGGADLNCQLCPSADGVGRHAAGERPYEHHRASTVYGYMSCLNMIAASTYHPYPPSRSDRTGVAKDSRTAYLDYIFTSPTLAFHPHPQRLLPFQPVSDHVPYSATITARCTNKAARRDLFCNSLVKPVDWHRTLPSSWLPNDPKKLQKTLLQTPMPSDLSDWPAHLIPHAKAATKWPQASNPHLLRSLWQMLRKTDDPTLRKACQTHIRAVERERRLKKKQDELLKWASGPDWSFRQTYRSREAMYIPQDIDGEKNRANWGPLFGTFLQDVYEAPPSEKQKASETFKCLQDAAARTPQSSSPICHPNDLRDLVVSLRPRKAPGSDGLCSNIIKTLPFPVIIDLARHFTAMASTLSTTDFRPTDWSTAYVLLIPKIPRPHLTKHFRPIALMSQIHKLYSKWLTSLARQPLEATLLPSQSGFRSGYQALESIHFLLRTLEVRSEWDLPTVLLRVDASKAFDRLYHSAIFSMLRSSPLHPRLAFLLARELRDTSLAPSVFGIGPPNDIRVSRGVKQGAPESALMFVATIAHTLQELHEYWLSKGWGLIMGSSTHTQSSYADDLICLASTPHMAKALLNSAQQKLDAIGLQLNSDKTECFSLPPVPSETLPGIDKSSSGLTVLGRVIAGPDATDADLERKLSLGWQKFWRLKSILSSRGPLLHRLRILRATVLQTVLWGSATWHPTQRRMQRLRGFHLAVLRHVIHFAAYDLSEEAPHPKIQHDRFILEKMSALKRPLLDSMYLTNYMTWAGHVARLPEDRPLKQVISFRDVAWFRTEQKNPWRTFIHTHKKGNLSRWENFLVRFVGPDWKRKARDRIEWEKICKRTLERYAGESRASAKRPTQNSENPPVDEETHEPSAQAVVPPRKRVAHSQSGKPTTKKQKNDS